MSHAAGQLPSAGPRRAGRGYAWFLASSGSWFTSHGVNQVMLPWLVVGELRATPEWTGTVQMLTTLPYLLFLLVGGNVADRIEGRRMLATLHALAMAPPLLLAAALAHGSLSIPVVAAAGMAMAVVGAFAHPARDSLLSQVAGGDVMRAVTGNTIAQFGAQGVGNAIAGAARFTGSPPVLLLQSLFVGIGTLAARRLPARAARSVAHAAAPGDFAAGLRFVIASDLRAVVILVFGIGLTFNGSYYVLMPLLVRDVYGGGVSDVSLVLAVFPLGTIGGSLLLLARGGIRRKGRGLVIALAFAALCLVVSGAGLPFPGVVAATFAWGLAGAVFLNTSRTLFQLRAPEAWRARVLSTNQLGFTAAGPLGALLSGFLAAHLGPAAALAVSGAGMLALVAAVTLASDVVRME